MKVRIPDYFEKFRCIADRCTDSCCIGWDVYLGEESAKRYKADKDEVLRFDLHIEEGDDGSYIKMRGDGRCPYLTEKGLCRIIECRGEGMLCEICAEHPRYYGIYGKTVEGGIGASCIEGARLILGMRTEPEYREYEDESFTAPFDECYFYNEEEERAFRDELMKSIWERDAKDAPGIVLRAAEHTSKKKDLCDAVKIIAESYGRCEHLKISRYEDLLAAKDRIAADAPTDSVKRIEQILEVCAKQVIHYALHRHYMDALLDGCKSERLLLSLWLLSLVVMLSYLGDGSTEEIAENLKDISKNVEYSTENPEIVTEMLSDGELADALAALLIV